MANEKIMDLGRRADDRWHDVKGLAARPGKRWDSIVSTLLAALVGGFRRLAHQRRNLREEYDYE